MSNSLLSWLIPLLMLLLGAALGALLVAWRARKRSEALHIELAVLKSHPNPLARIPLVQTVARNWRAQHP